MANGTFMADDALHQSGKGSTPECRSWSCFNVKLRVPKQFDGLSRQFDLSERQAYRYLEEASQSSKQSKFPKAQYRSH